MENRDENFNLQITKYQSFEKNYPSYSGGQIRTLEKLMEGIPTNKSIIDVGCGDGVALDWFKEKGFTDIEGIDGNPRKLEFPNSSGFKTYEGNIHNVSKIVNRKYDIIYSSHTLEHMVEPDVVIEEFKSILVNDGLIIIILPYPDRGPEDAHCGKFYLKTVYESDDAIDVVNVFKNHGLVTVYKEVANIREVEIFLKLKKSGY